MSAPQVFHLADNIQCHCWNKGATKIAYSPATKDVIVAKFENGKITTEKVLKGHDSRVLGLDWALESNRIVSCSEDRNALVWTQDEKGEWQPVLVLLRIDFAALDVKWSPNEQKFACASGNKLVAICKYNEESNWWASEHMKGFKSSATKVAWSPDSMTVAAASTDFECKIMNTFMKGLDQKGATSPFSSQDLSSPKCKLGTVLYKTTANGWVHSVSYTPSGTTVAYVAHDSTIGFIEANGEETTTQVWKTNTLPFFDVLCLNDNTVVAVGNNYSPYVFVRGANGWEFSKELDQKKSSTAGKTQMTAMEMFKSKTSTGTTKVRNAVEEIPTVHKNTVNCTGQRKKKKNGKILKFPQVD